jgi:hypothetical protein
MFARIVMLICLFLAIDGVNGLNFNENITVAGGGSLTSETNLDKAMDSVDATGVQEYSRNLSQEENSVSLSSKYNLSESNSKYIPYFRSFKTKTNPNGNGKNEWTPYSYSELFDQNSYTIQMKSPKKLLHSISIYGMNDIDSNNQISVKDRKVKTNFSIEGSGTLKESVIDLNTGTKPNYIIKTSINDTSFLLTSGLEDSIQMGSEIDNLIEWAREATSGPDSVSQTKKIDPERGIFGRQTQSDQATPTGQPPISGQATPTGQPPISGQATPTGQPPISGQATLTGQPPISGQATLTGQPPISGQATSTGQPPISGQATPTGQPPISGQATSTGQPLVTAQATPTGQILSGQTRDDAFIIMASVTNPVPAAYIGSVAQFNYRNQANLSSSGKGYKTFYEDGIVVSEDNECIDGICQNYTHIKADSGYGQPIGWRSTNTRSLRLRIKPIP